MGSIIRNWKQKEYFYEGTMMFPLFDTEIRVYADSEELAGYAEKCAEYLCNIPEKTVLRLCKYIIRYCENYREYFEEDDDIVIPENVSGTDILKYVRPDTLIVNKPDNSDVVGFHVGCGCDWEPEHGLEFTIRDGKILYAGTFDDMSAWDQERLDYSGFYDPDEYMSMNYADKEE